MISHSLGKWGSLIVCLLVLFALLLGGVRRLSFTVDEPSHISAGYAYLAKGTAGMWTIPTRGHPVLIDAWIAWPLYLTGPALEVEHLEGWQTNRQAYDRALVVASEPLERTEVLTRIPSVWLTLLLGAIIYRWATDLGGKKAGLLALSILIFDPTLLAHGRLATNDIGVTCLGTVALYWVWRWCRHSHWTTAGVSGIFLGLTVLAKGSGLLWTLAAGLAMLWQTFMLRKSGTQTRTTLWLQIMMMGGVAFAIMWAMYGFEVGPIPGLTSFPMPAPLHWRGLLYHSNQATGSIAFALGQVKHGHWWWYFPVAFLLKNPLPFLLGLLTSIIMLAKKFRFNKHGVTLSIFPVIYTTIAILQGPNIGYRHLLPVHPFLYLLLGTMLAPLLKTLSRPGRWIWLALALWYPLGTLRVYPYELTFFNELVGGASQGWRYLAASNTDWRQGWKALRAWQDEHNQSFYGPTFRSSLTPQDYGVQVHALPPAENGEQFIRPTYFPRPGDYLIRAHDLSTYAVPYDKDYAWFRYHTPDAVIANSLFYYHVTPPIEPTWLAQCSIPVAPLDESAIAQGFGNRQLRTFTFDCTHTWIYPQGGTTTGWYALHSELLKPSQLPQRLYLQADVPQDDFVAQRLSGASQSFRQWDPHRVPAFALYEWHYPAPDSSPSSVPLPNPPPSRPALAATTPTALETHRPITTTITFNEPLTFLGITIYENNNQVDIHSWWQMRNTEPITRPFSIMAHLLTPEGTILEIADGLGISPIALQTEDIFIQRHTFSKQNTAGLWLRMGAYWVDTGSRWSVKLKSQADALFIPLQ